MVKISFSFKISETIAAVPMVAASKVQVKSYVRQRSGWSQPTALKSEILNVLDFEGYSYLIGLSATFAMSMDENQGDGSVVSIVAPQGQVKTGGHKNPKFRFRKREGDKTNVYQKANAGFQRGCRGLANNRGVDRHAATAVCGDFSASEGGGTGSVTRVSTDDRVAA